MTIRTTAGIPREALPATLEMLLRMNGATMVKEAGIYKIVPQAQAVRGNITPQLGNSQRALPPGFSVQIVPLRYVGVREMMRILEPFAKDATAVRPDELRNLLILSGTEHELKHLLDTIDMFDVDWMSGMSVGLFTLQYADVKTVGQELDKAIGDKATSPLAGILRIIPIERLNALLVITPQPAYLEEAKKWIARLDQGGTGDGPSFYVYYLQNQRAEKLGPLLQQAFTGRAPPAAAPAAPTVAPGTPAGTIVSPPTFQAQPSIVQPTINVTTTPAPGSTPPSATPAAGRAHRRGPRDRAQHPGGRRQGQQHAADRRHGTGIPDDRGRAEEARRAAAAGDDRSHDRVGHAEGRDRLRRRMAVQGRRAVGPRLRRQPHALGAVQSSGAAGRRGDDRRHRGRQPGSRARAGLLSTSSTTRISRAASRPCCTCSTATATPR